MCTALLTRVAAGQQAYSTTVATVPRCAAEFRFVCGFPVVATVRVRTCGDSVGLRTPRGIGWQTLANLASDLFEGQQATAGFDDLR